METQPREYQLLLSPGWNLISFPGEPVRPDLASVFGRHAIMVLGYDGGNWETAAREGGQWKGSLEEVKAERGYFVLPVVPPMTLRVLLKPVPNHGPILADGWNLVGCIDGHMAPAGQPAGEIASIDEYLSETDWRVAHTLPRGVTQMGDDSEFERVSPGEGHLIRTGRGYWVWNGAGYDEQMRPPSPDVYLESDVGSRMGY